ncbi:MAG: hypothetical protein ABFS14_11890 [Gemmatimonadota bacterium]
MKTREDIESYLIRTGIDHEEIGEAMWLVESADEDGAAGHRPRIVVSVNDPLVLLRASLGTAPTDEKERLSAFQSLLQRNATDLVHGAYGLEDDEVILSDSMELENLDYSEFLASLESLALALASHRLQPATD